MKENEPKVVCFSCRFGWGYLAKEEEIAAQVKNWIPIICTGKIDTTYILNAFREGADGVLLLGCPEGGCHYQDGNIEARKRINLLYSVLESYGIESDRLRIHLATDPEGKTIPQLVGEMSDTVSKLGPLQTRKARQDDFISVRKGKENGR